VIPYSRQSIDKKDIAQVARVLRSDLITQGPAVQKLEKALCRYAGSRYAVVLSSGTAALHAAYTAAGFSKDDEVITSPITFLATTNAALYCGAKPVFVDVEKETGNINADLIQENISKKTKGIVPVHFAGHSCDMEKISRIARKNKLIVIEDAAHALGAQYKGKKIGCCRYSDMTVLSFHPVKSITTGEGGAVLTNEKKYYEKLLMFRHHGVTRNGKLYKTKGMSNVPWYYEMQTLGYNYRLTDLQCALGISQLKKLNTFIQKRRNLARQYSQVFRNNPFFDLPVEKNDAHSSWHLYSIRFKNKDITMKKEIFNLLRKNGLGVQVHYIPVYLQPFYQQLGYQKGLCPMAEDFYARELSIPLFASMTLSQKRKVLNILSILKKYIRR